MNELTSRPNSRAGPQGANIVADIHTTELLADLDVVLFLFEMGVHLSLPVLWEMRSIVFGLGGAQMAVTSILVARLSDREETERPRDLERETE